MYSAGHRAVVWDLDSYFRLSSFSPWLPHWFPFPLSSPGVHTSSQGSHSRLSSFHFLPFPFYWASRLLSSAGPRAGGCHAEEARGWRDRHDRREVPRRKSARRAPRRGRAQGSRVTGQPGWGAARAWRAPGGRGRSVLAPAASSPHLWVGSAAWGRPVQDGGGLLRGEEAETVQFAPLWLGWRWWRLLLLPL